jgi:hypothetical protein
MLNFKELNEKFGGKKALDSLAEAQKNNFPEVAEGTYVCKLEKLELGTSRNGAPMVKGTFKILDGEFKKQKLFYNGVMAAKDPSKSGFCIHNVLEFLKGLEIFEPEEITFTGDFEEFNDLLLDIAEESEGVKFLIEVEKDGDFNRLTAHGIYE